MKSFEDFRKNLRSPTQFKKMGDKQEGTLMYFSGSPEYISALGSLDDALFEEYLNKF